MAVYKVIQDIEAEDRLVGPLTLKGFIYAMIAGALAFICVRLAMAGSLGDVRWGVIVILLPPIILFGILAGPFGRDQPTEVWLLSHVKFFLQNRKRVWDQSGPSYSVIITAPKKIEKILTKNLSQIEVKSRLKALAATLDSRGWALKNVDVNSTPPGFFQTVDSSSERLISPSSVMQPAPVVDIHAEDDILDSGSNAKARHFKEAVQRAEIQRRRELLANFNAARQQQKTADKAPPAAASPKPQPKQPAVTDPYRADKIQLAKSGNAFSVATLSRMANRHEAKVKQVGPNEVEIDLH